MLGIIKSKLKDRLIKDISLMFFSSSAENVFNLIFWLFMVRHLRPDEYGNLNSLVSALVIFSLPTMTIRLGITRFISEFSSRQDWGKIKSIIFRLGQKLIYVSLLILCLFVFLYKPLGNYLRISDPSSLFFLLVLVLFNIFSPITQATLQGLERFGHLSVNIGISGLVKLICGILFVSLGFGYLGALGGFLCGSIFAFSLSLFQIPKMLWRAKVSLSKSFPLLPIFKYFFTVGLAMLTFGILTNIDVIMVKHYFSPQDAGYYSISQMVGKIILFLPAAFSIVLFPKTSGLSSLNKNTFPLLKKFMLLAGAIIFIAVIIVLVLPGAIIKILTAKTDLVLIPLARLFAIGMGMYAMVSILLNYHLSIKNTRYIYICVLFCCLEVASILLFHQNLKTILYILIFTSSCLFLLGLREAIYRGSIYAES
ncbi:MAG: oligosaccharide flippase family protein [Candidatus Omnitrophota bacterium]